MSGAVDSYTANFNLKKVNFNWVTWHDLEHENWDVIDALLYNVAGISNIQGVWENDLTVVIGDRYIDDTSGKIYEVQVVHTTAVSGTFAADRAANPTYWLVIEPLTPVSKGTWANSTPYTVNDYVQIEGVVAIAVDTHTSRASGTIDDDIIHWNYLIDIRSDIAQTAADVVSTNADVVTTGNDVDYAEEWAIKAEDSPVSVAAGGNGSNTFSALHWAAKSVVATFLSLTDTFSSYSGNALKPLRVNAGATAIEAYTPVADVTFTGMIFPYGASTAPTGFLLCNGQSVSRTTYADLFAVIGTDFGTVDGGTFNVPDARGRTLIGLDNLGGSSANRVTSTEADSVGGNEGAETHTLSDAEMPSHNHSYTIASDRTDNGPTNPNSTDGWVNSTTTNSGNAGSDSPHNNMQPYLAVGCIIKT